ncbi:protein disulfide-isomerase tmx3a-like [Diabrotica undecimpunctata]|uniref:protein disulfide-isomerase tmx3a-like n=1 Tax=Diabrotica undecimpunctata TaxID=50387 RepID=UPI003B638B81
MFFNTFNLVLIGLCATCCSSLLIELGDNFSELRNDGGDWLIKFYAPWCGHCQRLEPVWTEVSEALRGISNIRVGRIDCSHYPAIATEFGIRGYPTIKFISSNSDVTFSGDRNKDDIVQFALRMVGPPVHIISSSNDLSKIKSSGEAFFMYNGALKGELWNTFYCASKRFRAHSLFFAFDETCGEFITSNENKENCGDAANTPSIYMYKDNKAHFFQVDNLSNRLNDSLSQWVNKERFGTFQKVTHGNINDLIQLNRFIVLVVVNEKKLRENPDMLNYRNMVEKFAISKKEKYNKNFVFGWTGNPELANSIALKVVPLPYLIVLNSTTHEYNIPESDCSKMTEADIETFLDDVNMLSLPTYGGNSFFVRLYRGFFETKTIIKDMWQSNPIMTSLIFIIPLMFLSFIFYTLCFADVIGAEEEEEEEYDNEDEEDDLHMKKE